MTSRSSRLGQILVRAKLISSGELANIPAGEEDLSAAVARAKGIGEEQVTEALARHYGLPFVALRGDKLDPEALAFMTADQARRYQAVPVSFAEDGTLVVAVANPVDYGAKEALEFGGLTVRLALATPRAIREAIASRYDAGARVAKPAEEPVRLEVVEDGDAGGDEPEDSVLDLLDRHEARPVVAAVSGILQAAIERRASDIHVEPTASDLRIRCRVDGVLEEMRRLPRRMQPIFVARLKVLACLDIAERRVPQDGRLRVRLAAQAVDVRVSTLPTLYGEKVVLRILDSSRGVSSLDALGFAGEQLEAIRAAIRKPQGAILVTGPTGSGKSSTLFAMLREVISRPINIVTIENPIEYDVAGLNQVQVNDKAGLTFAATLRSILRQDPNIILVGEIRDRETAEIAFQAAMTGHLVLSTLHTNDAPNSISRLADLGVAPYLVASSLALVVAQRLARRVCPDCRERHDPDPEALRPLGLEPGAGYARGAGCPKCHGAGFRGRIVVSESLAIDAGIRELISARGSEGSIRRAMRAARLPSMAEDAAAKVREGVTTPEEVLRVVEVPAAGPACPRCGESLESDYMGCPHCLIAVRPMCGACRQPLKDDWAGCPYCGAPRRAAARLEAA